MSEFADMLARHRQLSSEVNDQREYLAYAESQLVALEKEMQDYVSQLENRPIQFIADPTQYPPVAVAPVRQLKLAPAPQEIIEDRGSTALQETAQALLELGDGVDARRLAEHLHITREAARLRLQRAARRGLIARMANGRYRPIRKKPQETKGEWASEED